MKPNLELKARTFEQQEEIASELKRIKDEPISQIPRDESRGMTEGDG